MDLGRLRDWAGLPPWGDEKRGIPQGAFCAVREQPELNAPEGLFNTHGDASEFIFTDADGYGGRVATDKAHCITEWRGPTPAGRGISHGGTVSAAAASTAFAETAGGSVPSWSPEKRTPTDRCCRPAARQRQSGDVGRRDTRTMKVLRKGWLPAVVLLLASCATVGDARRSVHCHAGDEVDGEHRVLSSDDPQYTEFLRGWFDPVLQRSFPGWVLTGPLVFSDLFEGLHADEPGDWRDDSGKDSMYTKAWERELRVFRKRRT